MNKCYTYFSITGDFDVDVVAKTLQIAPFKYFGKHDLRKDGKEYGFSSFSCCLCEQYDVYCENQIKKTIAPLKDKIAQLQLLQKQFDVKYVIQVVPYLRAGESAPSLVIDTEIIDFCHAARAAIDTDMHFWEE